MTRKNNVVTGAFLSGHRMERLNCGPVFLLIRTYRSRKNQQHEKAYHYLSLHINGFSPVGTAASSAASSAPIGTTTSSTIASASACTLRRTSLWVLPPSLSSSLLSSSLSSLLSPSVSPPLLSSQQRSVATQTTFAYSPIEKEHWVLQTPPAIIHG
jgi:hypothetical protein